MLLPYIALPELKSLIDQAGVVRQASEYCLFH